jgi:hypothetical protein
MLRQAMATAPRAAVRIAARVRVAGLSSKPAPDFPGVTNSASKFDPRKFLQEDGPHSNAEVASMRRALLYRSRQTGWLETDLIMGRWAAEASTFSKKSSHSDFAYSTTTRALTFQSLCQNLDKLSLEELQEYAKIVKVLRHVCCSPDCLSHRARAAASWWLMPTRAEAPVNCACRL